MEAAVIIRKYYTLPSYIGLLFTHHSTENICHLRAFRTYIRPDKTSILIWNKTLRSYRVKLGSFGHQVNSDIHLQTVEIQMRYAVSSGFSLFAYLIYVLFQSSNMKRTTSLSEFSPPSKFTRLYPNYLPEEIVEK